jgi:hypothetical protein
MNRDGLTCGVTRNKTLEIKPDARRPHDCEHPAPPLFLIFVRPSPNAIDGIATTLDTRAAHG